MRALKMYVRFQICFAFIQGILQRAIFAHNFVNKNFAQERFNGSVKCNAITHYRQHLSDVAFRKCFSGILIKKCNDTFAHTGTSQIKSTHHSLFFMLFF